MLNFAEEITLLLLDDDTGDLVSGTSLVINRLMAGAVLMDLAYHSKIDADLEKVMVADSTPTGDPILDPYLARMAEAESDLEAGQWIKIFSGDGDEILQSCQDALVEKGILKLVDKRILWVIGLRRYPMIDDKEEREVKLRLLDVLLSDKIPYPRDVVLICLADAGGLFDTILSERELDHAADRIAQVSKLDLLGQALSNSVAQLRRDIQIAAMSHPM